jgi:hypothetical protein
MGSEAVCDRRLKYAASLSPGTCSRKAGLDDDCFGVCDGVGDGFLFFDGHQAYIMVLLEEACVEADADWIPDSRESDRDGNGENASTLPLLTVRATATKSANTSDDEGAEIGIMMRRRRVMI